MARSPRTEPRTERFEARAAPAKLATIKRAAEAMGRSASDYVIDAAHEAAVRDLREAEIIRLTREESERFVALLLNPPKRNAAMKRAAALHARLIKSS